MKCAIKKILKIIFTLYYTFVQWSLKPILFKEYKFPDFSKINERPIEYSFVFNNLWQICPNSILDVGTGRTSLPFLMANCGFKVTAIDKVENY